MPTARYVTKQRCRYNGAEWSIVEWHQNYDLAEAYANKVRGYEWTELVDIYALAWVDSIVGAANGNT